MVQGTTSSSGKSVLVAALCRIFLQDGYRVAPFKSQNMALNSFVTPEGGEIGRAQATQAEAAGILPLVHMNPVLLKPEADSRCQIVLMGRVDRTISARDYYKYTPKLLGAIQNSLNYLRNNYDIVVIEGAGSPAEINLKDREIVNMRIAKIAQSPVLLVGDIDRGGVFAQLYGTLELLEADERALIRGLVINKFRGDISLLNPGLKQLEELTSVPVTGVVPYIRNLGLAEEDSVYLDEHQPYSGQDRLHVSVIRLPHISNYDDFDPLQADGCSIFYVNNPAELENTHLIIIPGTKSTIADLKWLVSSGLASKIMERFNAGTPVIGICGGYQMMGNNIFDPTHIESATGQAQALGLLNADTTFAPEKATTQVKAEFIGGYGILAGINSDEKLTGYEIHMGQTASTLANVFRITTTPMGGAAYTDGSINEAGTAFGTYLHGIFHNNGFRHQLLENLKGMHGISPTSKMQTQINFNREDAYNRLAETVRKSLDISAVYGMMGLRQ
ncbi:cobyric acid synthase [Chloroflexota bacterium]